MGNLISVLVHCEIRGSEVILGNNSHIHIYKNGGMLEHVLQLILTPALDFNGYQRFVESLKK
ncbi:putative pyridoxal phosphate-dependent transferase, major domain-containing protein [Helianthus debilis subsp. tardiflorus]